MTKDAIKEKVIVTDELEDQVVFKLNERKYTGVGDLELISGTTSEKYPKTLRAFEIPGKCKLNLLTSDVAYELLCRLWKEQGQVEFEIETDPVKTVLVAGNYKYNSTLLDGSYVVQDGEKVSVTGCALKLTLKWL